MSLNSQVLDHTWCFSNSLCFNIFAFVTGVREMENRACIGKFVQICSRARNICETGVRGYILAGLVPIDGARLAQLTWFARITNEEEEYVY